VDPRLMKLPRGISMSTSTSGGPVDASLPGERLSFASLTMQAYAARRWPGSPEVRERTNATRKGRAPNDDRLRR
jgi:hypothetical protein